MNKVWILQVDNSPDLEAFENEELAMQEYRNHIESRLPGLENDWLLTECYINYGHMSCHYDGAFVASLDELEVKNGNL